MKLTEVRIEIREEEAEELAKILRVLLERAWPEVVVRVGNNE
ncbi:hypothetical protein LCGC14_2461390 [marine sediment metagenome]|uniref:Uncharacterized protein n=1 Tax=marine sediment metagenome TaxID=412755 RepID=A0A0F9E711_9ZZZZ